MIIILTFLDVLLVDTKTDLNLHKNGEVSESVTPCYAASSSGCSKVSKTGRKELDCDLNEWICTYQLS